MTGALTERPAPVTIDDLDAPRFSSDVQPVLDFMAEAGRGLELAPEPLMAAAVEETGLDDFGAPDFLARLEVLCTALRREANLSPVGVLSEHSLLVQLLRNRLLIEDRIRRHPEILDVEIAAPIVICGLPRTGTTHLHNLMSADPALRSLPYWESLEPLLPEDEQAALGDGPDPRRARTEQGLWLVNAAMPYFKRMHEMTVDHVHEEIQLLAIDFSTMLFETIAPMPTWRDYYLAHDQRSSYRYLRRILQVLQWERGGARWVLKSPQHLEQFPALYETFPDATFVVTHRDPVSVTASMGTMLAYTRRLASDPVEPRVVGAYWADRLERMLRKCVEERDVLPGEQALDVRFDDFMADDVAMVEQVYRVAGQPMTAEARRAMVEFMADHPRGRHGAVAYDMEQLGLEREERRRALRFYTERFALREEG